MVCQSNVLQRTLIYGEPNHPEIDVIAAQLEPSVVRDNAADLVSLLLLHRGNLVAHRSPVNTSAKEGSVLCVLTP